MITKILILLMLVLGLGLGLGVRANAQLSIITEPSDQTPAMRKFISQATSLLPLKMTQKLNQNIYLKFKEFKESRKLLSPCDALNGEKVIFGEARGKKTIYLNSLFRNVIHNPQQFDKNFDCQHGSFYKTAVATLVHEIAHLYDRGVGFILPSNISSQKRYKILAGYDGVFKDENDKLKTRFKRFATKSPDHYEYTNMQEHFAVNFEYFILDPNYACRRKALYDFFKDHFEHTPFEQTDCQADKNISVIIANQIKTITIDPERIYDIHYLHAGQGEASMSRWGHAMFRIIYCAPQRNEVGEACLKDVAEHIVVGFSAIVESLQISNLAGLSGKYQTFLSFSDFSSVSRRYNYTDLRDLRSIPLNLSREKIDLFISHIINLSWEYQAQYKFLSTNCATEAGEILKVLFDEKELIKKKFRKPTDIYKTVMKRSTLPSNYFEDKRTDAINKGLLYISLKDRLDRCYNVVKENDQETNFPTKLEDLHKMEVSARKRSYQSAFTNPNFNTLACLSLIESQRLSFIEKQLTDKTIIEIEEQKNKNNISEEDEKFLLNHFKTKHFPSPESEKKQGYGTTLKDETTPTQFEIATKETLIKIIQIIRKSAKKYFPEDYQVVDDTRALLGEIDELLLIELEKK